MTALHTLPSPGAPLSPAEPPPRPAAFALPPVLAYHKIDTGLELGVNVVAPGAFRSQMEWLAEHGFAGISLAEAIAEVGGAQPGRAGRRPAVLTFDDGYEGLLRHALPVLSRLGFRGTLFVPSAYVGRWSDWDTRLLGRRYRHLDAAGLRAFVAAGFELGSHSATHADLRRVDDARLDAEAAGSRRALEEIAGRRVVSFAYPFGRADARVRAAVARAGYRAACGGALPGGRGTIGETGRAAPLDLLAIPRFGVRAPDGVRSLAAKLAGGPAARWERAKERLAHAAAGGTAPLKALCRFL